MANHRFITVRPHLSRLLCFVK